MIASHFHTGLQLQELVSAKLTITLWDTAVGNVAPLPCAVTLWDTAVTIVAPLPCVVTLWDTAVSNLAPLTCT